MNKAKYLILIILIIFLITPRPAFAFIGTGIFDFFETALGGIEEFAGPIIKWVTQFIFIYIISLFSLFLSGSLLQYIISQQGSLGFSDPASIGFNFVQAGWQITSSLANMAILLIFLVIAFAWILKIENFVAQKALVKLIFAALLVNFSLLFVGILVDISNVFFNAFLDMGGGSSIVSESINRVFGGLWGTLSSMITLLIARAVLAMIPFTAPFIQLAFVVTLSVLLLPQIVFWIFQVLIGFFLASIFFLYFLLFAFRMFVIWILAVLSPLAFVCFVLPQTKKYWDEWLKHLMEWVLMGIFALFFLILGLKTIGFVAPAPTPIPFATYGAIPGWFVYYFFMFIYFCVALFLIKKATPQIASFIMDQGKSWGSRAVGLGMPYLRAIRQRGQETAARSERIQRQAQRMSTWTGPRGRFGRVAAETFMIPEASRAIGRAIRPPSKITEERIEGARKGIESDLRRRGKGQNREKWDQAAIRVQRDNFPKYTPEQKIAATRHFIGKGAGNALFGNMPEQERNYLLAQSRRIGADTSLLNIDPERFARLFGMELERVIRDIPQQEAHNIGIESLKSPNVVVNLSIGQLENIIKEGSQEKQEVILNTHFSAAQLAQFGPQMRYLLRSPLWQSRIPPIP